MELKFEEIACREYSIKGEGGKVIVAIGKPQKQPDTSDYYCEYKITAFNEEKILRIFGLDSFQTLHLTIKIIDSELRRITKNKSVKLEWQGGELSELPFPE